MERVDAHVGSLPRSAGHRPCWLRTSMPRRVSAGRPSSDTSWLGLGRQLGRRYRCRSGPPPPPPGWGGFFFPPPPPPPPPPPRARTPRPAAAPAPACGWRWADRSATSRRPRQSPYRPAHRTGWGIGRGRGAPRRWVVAVVSRQDGGRHPPGAAGDVGVAVSSTASGREGSVLPAARRTSAGVLGVVGAGRDHPPPGRRRRRPSPARTARGGDRWAGPSATTTTYPAAARSTGPPFARAAIDVSPRLCQPHQGPSARPCDRAPGACRPGLAMTSRQPVMYALEPPASCTAAPARVGTPPGRPHPARTLRGPSRGPSPQPRIATVARRRPRCPPRRPVAGGQVVEHLI